MRQIEFLKKIESEGGWISDNIRIYRASNKDDFSIYFLSNNDNTTPRKAIEEIEENNIFHLDYVGQDTSVAQHLQYEHCFVFHYRGDILEIKYV